MKKSVGYNVDFKPEKKDTTSEDKNDPYFGNLSVRGKMFEGIVVSDSMRRTVKVGWDAIVKDAKYNRYFKKRTKVSAHNPDSILAKKGDTVLIGECRPLSKTKHFVVLKILGDQKQNEGN